MEEMEERRWRRWTIVFHFIGAEREAGGQGRPVAGRA